MIFEFETEHYALNEVIFELIRKENKELKAVDKEVFYSAKNGRTNKASNRKFNQYFSILFNVYIRKHHGF